MANDVGCCEFVEPSGSTTVPSFEESPDDGYGH
jgi:hypothetical protein